MQCYHNYEYDNDKNDHLASVLHTTTTWGTLNYAQSQTSFGVTVPFHPSHTVQNQPFLSRNARATPQYPHWNVHTAASVVDIDHYMYGSHVQCSSVIKHSYDGTGAFLVRYCWLYLVQ